MEEQVQPKANRRTIAMAVGASLLLVLFVAGLAFANSIGASHVAANASALHWANAALGTSSLTRAAMAQATTTLGLPAEFATDQDVDFAMEQVTNSYAELVHLAELGEHSPSLDLLMHYIGAVEATKAALDEGESELARELVQTDLEARYIEVVDSLQVELSDIQHAITENVGKSRTFNGYIVFVLTLLIPASAVGVYWWIARTQVREYRLKAEVELDAERAVGRAKDGFIAGLSHELRTPLTSIYGFAEILADGASSEGQTHELSQIIANEAAEMTRMVDDLLAASRLDSTGIEIEMNPTRINDVVESAITPFARAGLEIRHSSTPAMVYTDGARLRHVLVNLISNAARHGGPTIGIELSPGESTLDIEVWDNGVGVPDDQVERLFERFVHEGSQSLLAGSVGLGLAVASRLTGMLEGELSYQRFGGKTYFIVSVPTYVVEADESDDVETSVAEVIKALSA